MQFIVFDNAKAGFNGEHSMMDATPTSRLCEHVCEALDKGTVNHGTSSGAPLPEPARLEFDVNSEIQAAIANAETKFKALTGKHDLKVVNYERYGKNLIKKLKLSPDAFAQMAIQLAYFKMYGKAVPTYESAQTKKFAWGRTETCRSCTLESVEWCKAMQDQNLSVRPL
jgi:carnitine O-acetyltransferase